MASVHTTCVALIIALAGAACGPRTPTPAPLDTAHEACLYCRMIVSDARFASQIVTPYEEPRFFDDLGCLGHYLETSPLAAGATVFVADHRTRSWVPATSAVFTRLATARAPMGSPIVAHESAASRDADPDARGGAPIDIRDVLPPRPRGGRP